jgi:hypothetical protein
MFKGFNKKGDLEISLSAWWFFVIFLVGGAIVVSVSIYYSADFDSKGLESDLLSERILNCISSDGLLVEGVFEENNFYKVCNLNKEKFGFGSNYFFKVVINNKELIKGGDYSVEKNCELGEELEVGKYFPVCSQKEDFVFNENGEAVIVQVLTASNQRGKMESGI